MKTNSLKFSLAVLAVASALTVFASCNKENADMPNPKSIVEVASANSQFSILTEALTKAGLSSTLKTAGPFTVFAPTNEAFKTLFTELGVTGLADLSAETLKPILLNHVISGNVKASDLTTGYVETYNNSAPDQKKVKIYINKGNSVMVDKSKVIITDVLASNGVIHAVDKVILPPSVLSHAKNNPNFSILVQAVGKAGLVDALSGSGPFTIFAPTNAAFTALFASMGISGINDLTAAQLAPILLYHVVSGNVVASQVASGSVPTLKAGSSISIMADNMGVKLNGKSNVIATDVQGSNGVIHAIDAVLLP
jgi:transforming growth factor-beta-induced protein